MNCDKCKHDTSIHYSENGLNYQCWERNSIENNDFCGCQYGKLEDIFINLYVVKNSEGKYFHAKGRSSSGLTWVDNIINAKIYTKISQAKARVTYFANNYKNYPAPQILELHVTGGLIISQESRLQELKNIKEAKIKVEKIKCKELELKSLE